MPLALSGGHFDLVETRVKEVEKFGPYDIYCYFIPQMQYPLELNMNKNNSHNYI